MSLVRSRSSRFELSPSKLDRAPDAPDYPTPVQTRRLVGVTVACVLLWAASGGHWARAQGGGARLRIDCSPPLDEAARAALEGLVRAPG